ncbi:MAG: ATP-dependent Clp protease ATP-binding subunit [Proteobacteria bacterium]|nr:ATP-dependent Clp protease ATP-binding subunit [Pseudomonadota bacterium]
MEPNSFSQILNDARAEAIARRNLYMTSEHLLWSLLSTQELERVFSDFNIKKRQLMKKLEHYFETGLERDEEGQMPEDDLATMTPGLEQAVNRALLHGVGAGILFPRAIDFVIALMADEDSYGYALFASENITPLKLMRWAGENPEGRLVAEPFLSSWRRSGEDEDGEDDEEDWQDDDAHASAEEEEETWDGSNPESRLHALARFKGILTEMVSRARAGKLDPVVGRDREIDACCQTLLRRNKRNVIIVGESGVGKTAIVEGLANRIAQGEVADPLRDIEIYSLDVTALMAGTKFRGEMEARLRKITHFLKKIPKGILFIDEMHLVAGHSTQHGGAQDVLSLLKPGLADGSLRVIGTTTHTDYRRTLADDTALLRRFFRLVIDEPDVETTKRILREIRDKYESFHAVLYEDDALDAAVTLTDKFLTERKFPDKAIDVIDEAGAANRMKPLGEQKATLAISDIEEIVAKVAHIPDIQASDDERGLLQKAEQSLKSVVFGQDSAIDAIVRLVKLSRAGLRAQDKTAGSFLFAGPTGVGKTEIARQLAKTLRIAFVRFDMSEYREEYTVSRFIGSAPGYVGYEKGGLLTEAIRATPRCVLLLDEIEKAHPSIYDLLLQVMDAARLTDNAGRIADFKNVILVMTSNAGGADMGQISIGFSQAIDLSKSQKAIERTFSPEFRNRLDEIVIFNPLAPNIMIKIVDKMIAELQTRIADKDITLHLHDEARQWLAKHGYDERFGARPLARLIQNTIAVPLSDEILFGTISAGGRVEIAMSKDGQSLTLLPS